MGLLSDNPNSGTRADRARARVRAAIERIGTDSELGRELLRDVLTATSGNELNLRSLIVKYWAPDYIRKPVPVREFILDEYYLGRGVGRSTYPQIIEDLEELFAGDYTEVILAGSIGWGKTRFAEIAIAYELYQLSLLRDPAATYGLMTGSTLAFVNCSVNVTQARKVLFGGLASMLAQGPYFREVFPYDKKVTSELRFPKSVRAYPVAASESAQLGEGVFSCAIDEVNFLQIIQDSKRNAPGAARIFDQAEVVYNKLRARIRSRFNQRGKLPGHIYLISSARYPGDFTERMEKLAREPENRHRMFVRHWAAWQTKPASTYRSDKFKVEVGDITRRSRVLAGDESDVNQERVVEVPMDFYPEFVMNPEACVRDYCGISTLSIKPFISKREAIQQAFELGRAQGLENAFTRQNVTLQDRDPALECLVPERLHWIEQVVKDAYDRPLVKDGKVVTERVLFPALRFAHFDLSKTKDATGLVIGHVVGSRKVSRFEFDPLGRVKEEPELKPVIWIELVLRIVAPPNGQIDIPRARMLIYQLRALGIEFGMVSFDQLGSQESIKTLQDEGYTSDLYSVDRDTTAYDELRTALYDGRIILPYDAVLERELAQLEDTGKKIDHPPNGSKDLSDGLAAVTHHAEASWAKGEGARGLFQFGVVEKPGELSEDMQTKIEAALAKVVEGQALSNREEDTILFQGMDEL